jgi:hypothetical protein
VAASLSSPARASPAAPAVRWRLTRCASVGAVGDNHEGHIITGKPPSFFRKNNKTNPQTTNHTLHSRGLVRRRAHGPNNLSGPSSSQPRPPRPNFRLARGPGTAPRNLCLYRGLNAPSGESPPRSRAERPDEDTTSTSIPATPSPTPAPVAPSSTPPSGPITRARARDFNFVIMLKNEGPKD